MVASYKSKKNLILTFLLAMAFLLCSFAMADNIFADTSYYLNPDTIANFFNTRLTQQGWTLDPSEAPFDRYYTLDQLETFLSSWDSSGYVQPGYYSGIYSRCYRIALNDFSATHNSVYAFISNSSLNVGKPQIILSSSPFNWGAGYNTISTQDTTVMSPSVTVYNFSNPFTTSPTFTKTTQSNYSNPLFWGISCIPDQFGININSYLVLSSGYKSSQTEIFNNSYNIPSDINNTVGNNPLNNTDLELLSALLKAQNLNAYYVQLIAKALGLSDYSINQRLEMINTYQAALLDKIGSMEETISGSISNMYDKLENVFPSELVALNDSIVEAVTNDDNGFGLTEAKVGNTKAAFDDGLSTFDVDTSGAEYSNPFQAVTHGDWRFFSTETANNLTVQNFNNSRSLKKSGSDEDLEFYNEDQSLLKNLLGW